MLLLLCFFAEDTTCNVLKTLFSICIETLTINIVFNITHVHVSSVETLIVTALEKSNSV